MVSSARKTLGNITTVILWILFVLGSGAYLALPWWVEQYLQMKDLYNEIYFRNMMIVLYPAGLCAIFMTYFTIRLMMNVCKNKSFIKNNVRLLTGISVCAFAMAVIFLAAVWILLSVFVFFMVIIFSIVGLVSLILSGLFKVALRYKEENELTI